jgi:hypothetical protein
MGEIYYSFDGDEWCEGCSGWDGESIRCDCGSRRVYWECMVIKCTHKDKNCAGCEYATARAD